jgi:CRP-like cAMP-binding protein
MSITTSNYADIVLFLQKNKLFSGLSEQQFQLLLPLMEVISLDEGEYLIREGEHGKEFFILQEGTVEVLKKQENSDIDHRLTVLHAGEAIGEIALVEKTQRTASIRAITSSILLKFPIDKLKNLSLENSDYAENTKKLTDLLGHLQQTVAEPPVFARLTTNLAKTLSDRLYKTNVITVDALKKELEHAKTRISMGKFMISVISLMMFYLFSLKATTAFANQLLSTTLVSIPLILIFAGVLFYFIKDSGYPLSTFGLTFNNWKKAIIESLAWTPLLLLIVIILKWITIHTVSSMKDTPLLQFSTNEISPFSYGKLLLIIAGYLIMTPVQEFITRGCLQSSLQEFFVGPRRIFLAILISNLLFSGSHLHISLGLALFVFFFGLFWGWLYSRHSTLVGVSLSHLIVGGFAFFIVGIQLPF